MKPAKSYLITNALVMACLLSGCAADFLFEGSAQQYQNEDVCDCDEPHPNPTPTPGPNPKPPCPRKPPQINACDLRVILDVAQIEVVKNHGQAEVISMSPGEVDLCELSKDFFGVLAQTLKPQWRPGEGFNKIHFILSSRLERNRVEAKDGSNICGLRLPPGMTAGVRFEPIGANPLSVETGLGVTFDFDQSDALHQLGAGFCQLQHPIGHYDLREGH